ncbi:MAG: hypothetical protein ACRESY_10205 [Steroidobacteraceae bacterium]
MRNRHGVAVMTIATATLLAACGGGSGGSYAPQPQPNLMSAPGEQSYSTFLQTNSSGTLSATNGADTYSIQYTFTASTNTTTFNGSAPAYSTTSALVIGKDNQEVATGTATTYYLLNHYVPLGQVEQNGTPYAVVTSSTPLPTTFTVGDSGSVYNQTYYHDSTMTVLDASESLTYAVQVNNSSTIMFCTTSQISGVTAQGTMDGLADGAETDCYTIDASGNMTFVSVSVEVGGVNLLFQ